MTHCQYEQLNTIIHTQALQQTAHKQIQLEHKRALTKFLSIENKKIKKSNSPAFADCAWLKRQIECVASESNYFLESHTVALFPFDLHLPVCQLRHLAHWHKMLSPPQKNSYYIYWRKKNIWCRDVIRTWKQCYSWVLKNISRYNTGQIALIKYTGGSPADTERNDWSYIQEKKIS